MENENSTVREPRPAVPPSLLQGFTRKPPLIVLFSALYLLNPIGNFLFLVFWSTYPPEQVFRYLGYASFIKPDPFVLGTLLLWAGAVVLAFGLYRVRLWAWYGFLGHSVLTVLSSVYGAAGGEFGLTRAFLINALVLIPVGFFLRKEIRKPYFHPQMRWWEQHARLRETVKVRLSWNEFVFEENTFDLAPDGIFVQTSNLADIAVGYFFNVRLYFGDEREIGVQAVVVWINFESGRYPPGYGLKFLGISTESRSFIGSYIRRRLRRGATTRHNA